MAKRTPEIDLIQNEALGSLALWHFVAKYYEEKSRIEGPLLPLAMVVLPAVFNRDFVLATYTRHQNGGLYQALSDSPSIITGLQTRIESMMPQTFRSLNVAIAGELLAYDAPTITLRPKRLTDPFHSTQEDQKQIFFCADRLGYWFASLANQQISELLQVRLP